jgi:hypothetical protein
MLIHFTMRIYLLNQELDEFIYILIYIIKRKTLYITIYIYLLINERKNNYYD